MGSNSEYTMKYVIERMCTGTLPHRSRRRATCVVDQNSSQERKPAVAAVFTATARAVNYRVTVRVEGPRNTVAMSQAIVAF